MPPSSSQTRLTAFASCFVVLPTPSNTHLVLEEAARTQDCTGLAIVTVDPGLGHSGAYLGARRDTDPDPAEILSLPTVLTTAICLASGETAWTRDTTNWLDSVLEDENHMPETMYFSVSPCLAACDMLDPA